MTDAGGWDGYVARYHEANPGITEDLLAAAVDTAGRTPYDWLLQAVPAEAGLIVDLACGNGPVLRRCGCPAVGLDRSANELARARKDCPSAPLVRADGAALPLATAAAGAVTISMALMVLPAAQVLAELARVVRAGGVLAATMPSRGAGAAGFAEILTDLGQAGVDYPEPFPDAAARLETAGFELRADETASFRRPVATAEEAELVVRSFYAPGEGEARRRVAAARLRERVAAGPITLPYPIRRIVAVRRD